MGLQVFDRVNPLRKPKGFEPVVQRWSAGFANKCETLCVAFHGIQGRDAESVYASPFFPWIEAAVGLPCGPTVHDHAWFIDQNGLYTHIVAAYWLDQGRRDDWLADPHLKAWWTDAARLAEPNGYFRESLTVPVERQETLYWKDYPAALSRSPEVAVYPTPYCGYYGAMRDRIPLAAVDALAPVMKDLPAAVVRETRSARWRIVTPRNFTGEPTSSPVTCLRAIFSRAADACGRCCSSATENASRSSRIRASQ